jgi:autotransporter-associated beta strand protein
MTLPVSSFPVGGPQNLTINGATMVAVLEPTLPTFGYPGNVGGITIASVYDTQFGLGAGGALTATIAGGSVTGVTVTSGGSGYTSPPTVTFAAPGGMSANTTATGTAQISSAGQVTNVIVTSGGSGYAWQRTAQVLNVPVPTVTFSGGGGSGAAGTAVMSTAAGCQIEGIVNQNRPTDTADTPTDNAGGNGWNWANAGYGIPTSDDVYIPVNQISVVSIVAGSGLNGVGQPTPGGPQDNNYMVYVNGVLVEDTAAGFVSSLTLTANNGAGYLPHGGTVPLSFNTPPGGTPATGYMQVSSSTTIPGHIRGVVLTSGGSGYTAADPPVITIPAPTDTTVSNDTAVVTFTDQSLGNYLPSTSGGVPSLAGAASAGWNGGGMSVLDYNLAHGTYGSGNANSTFGIGDQAGTGEIGLTGYLGDVTVYGEALTPAQRQALENAEGAKYITGATESFTITTSIGNGIITGPATVVQGYSATYNFIPTVAYAISGVTVDGVSVGAVTSYTFTDVSANHSIVVTTVAVPPQNITVTYGAGGTITTNGTVMPSGANWANITGGSYPAFTLAVSNGFALGVIKADGVTIPNATIIGAGGTYTFANIGGNGSGPSHTLTATFVALPTTPVSSAVPESEFLFFSVDTASLPQLPTFTGPTPITNWPMFYSSQGVTSMIQGASGGTPALANTFTDANGVVWENNIEGEGPTSTGYQFYPGGVGAATGTTIPNNGATIVTVVSPIENGLGAGDPWHSIVDVFFGCVELSVNPGTGLIQAIVDNDKGGYDGTASAVATSTYAIPSGSNTVLSLVVQPNGSFAVYANTVLVITNAGLGPLYMTAGEQGFTFANNIQIGSDGPDTWSCFNGLIGNTYFWTTALTTTERTNLEAALMTEFHAVVPPNFNWVGPNNGNWSDAANWSNTVPFAVNTVPGSGGGQTPVFSLAGAGLTVNLDVAESVAGLTFNSNAVIAAPTGNTLTLDDGAANPTITVGTNASATIGANLSLTEGLNVYGPGLLTLASNVTLGATTTGYVEVAQNGSSTATIVQTGGTLTTFSVAQSWATGNGPGVMLGGADNSATSATYTLSGGTLLTPNIGCVTENFGVNPAVLVPPSTDGAAAILNLNGGVLEASDNDSVDPNALAEGSAHLIFNTTHTYVQAGGAIISTGYSNSISVPLEHFPAGPAIDGGLTKMGAGILDLLAGSTYTGPTVVSNGILACATATSLGGNSVTIVPGAQLELEFTGTTTVYQLFTNGNLTSVPPGVYGSTASGAAHADDTDFAVGSPGKLTVLGAVTLGEKPLFTSSGFTGTAGNGSLLLQGTGGISGGTYLVLGSTNVAAPLADWVVLGQGTFTGAGFSVSVPVSATVPQEFIRIVVP